MNRRSGGLRDYSSSQYERIRYCNQGILRGEGFKWQKLANRNSIPGRLPVLFFILVVLAGIRPANATGLRIEQLRKAATEGDTTAQFSLGRMYDNGRLFAGDAGVERDVREAVKWYRMAAERGHATAQLKLSVFYSLGLGLPKDDREAVKWYRRAAEQGDARTQFSLANKYKMGDEGVSEGCSGGSEMVPDGSRSGICSCPIQT